MFRIHSLKFKSFFSGYFVWRRYRFLLLGKHLFANFFYFCFCFCFFANILFFFANFLFFLRILCSMFSGGTDFYCCANIYLQTFCFVFVFLQTFCFFLRILCSMFSGGTHFHCCANIYLQTSGAGEGLHSTHWACRHIGGKITSNLELIYANAYEAKIT